MYSQIRIQREKNHEFMSNCLPSLCFTVWSRKSSSEDSPLIHTAITLPLVNLETIPLYIYAGQPIIFFSAFEDMG